MTELLMIACLTLMGVYFFKSTDLPRDLKERVQNRAPEKIQLVQRNNVTKAVVKSPQFSEIKAPKLSEQSKDVAQINREIDQIVLRITALEEELKRNEEKRDEIIKEINVNLTKLTSLKMRSMNIT